MHSLGLINTGVPGSKPNLWVGLKWSTDFYPGCSSARKESESVVRVRLCGQQGQWLAASETGLC